VGALARSGKPGIWAEGDGGEIDEGGIGMSFTGFDPKRRKRWRGAVGGAAGAKLAAAIEKVESRGRKHRVEVAGDQVKKVPSPWPPDHQREDLLRRGSFQLRFIEPLPKAVDTPAFARWCATRLERLLPVHEWLVTEVA
jgi:hypothetical protein